MEFVVNYYRLDLNRINPLKKRAFKHRKSAERFAQKLYDSLPNEYDGHLWGVHKKSLQYVFTK